MGIHPNQSKRQTFTARHLSTRRHGACGETVVPTEHQRDRARDVARQRALVETRTHLGDVADVLLPLVAGPLRLRNRDGEVAFVTDRPSERREPFVQARDAHGRRAHVDAAATGPEIQRHADDMDRFHGRFFQETDTPSLPGDDDGREQPGLFWIVPRKSAISVCLLITLWARNRPPGSSRGKTRSKNFW